MPIPITILTGFLGAGKTTLLLNLLPQLPPTYKLALLKNEFGDVAVDSQLASGSAISGVRELLNGCICCNLVGQLGDALAQLRDEVKPDRIVIETSGSAFPATLVMEVKRIAQEQKEKKEKNASNGVDNDDDSFVLDGVISVIDVENWTGYEDTSYTAKMQARYTDLIIFNKWELCPEERFEVCLDRLGDLELDPPTPWVKSDRGRVDKDVLLGIDGALVAKAGGNDDISAALSHHAHDHDGHDSNHQSEVEVLSVTLRQNAPPTDDNDAGVTHAIDVPAFETLLGSASKEEVYRIKGVILVSAQDTAPQGSDPTFPTPTYPAMDARSRPYILNWAFGRWTFTPAPSMENGTDVPLARLTLILARGESAKWKKKLESSGFLRAQRGSADLTVQSPV
ncbi:hypothetical protein VTN31DRAFT_4513 [Thermomyces dupontii]|uniref:uncharacterized protein n=1 Tax=Talaromyces thermophilus TaxID=28565 RepID=UPI003744407F